jgi:hypothetical protein
MDYMGEGKAKSITQMGKLSATLHKHWTVESYLNRPYQLESLLPIQSANLQHQMPS